MPDPQETGQQPAPLFDMSKATPLAQPETPLFDMSKATPLQSPDEVAARHARSVSDARARGLQTNLPDQEDFMDHVRVGMGKRGLELAQGGVGLLNKGLAAAQNMDLSGKVTPDTLQIPVPGKELTTETHGVGETLGGLGTDVAALEAGGHVIKGFSTLLKLPEAALALAEKYPSISKHILSLAGKATGTGAEIVEGAVKSGKPALESVAKLSALRPGLAGVVGTAAKTAALTGTQGAVEGSAPEGEGAVKGAEWGALGGAVGGTFAEVTGKSIGKLLQAVGIGTSDEQDIIRALQRGKTDYKFLDDWKTAQPRIAENFKLEGEPENLGEEADRLTKLRRDVWNKEITPAIQKHGKEVLNTAPVANSVRQILIDHPEIARRFPKDAKFIEKFANEYTSGSPLFTGDITVEDAEKEIEQYNKKLDLKGYWDKSPKARAAMDGDPEIRAWRTASDSLREGLYQHLHNAGEPGMADLKNLYGAVGHMEDVVRGRANVVGRQQPVSLKQLIGTALGLAHGGPGGAAAIALPIIEKIYNDPISLLKRAVAKGEPVGPVKKMMQEGFKVAGEAAKKTAPAASGNLVRFIASDGSRHSVNADEWDKVKQIDSGAKKEN